MAKNIKVKETEEPVQIKETKETQHLNVTDDSGLDSWLCCLLLFDMKDIGGAIGEI